MRRGLRVCVRVRWEAGARVAVPLEAKRPPEVFREDDAVTSCKS
jgi:hypothetical protein